MLLALVRALCARRGRDTLQHKGFIYAISFCTCGRALENLGVTMHSARDLMDSGKGMSRPIEVVADEEDMRSALENHSGKGFF